MFRAHLAATVAALVLAAGAVPASAQCVSAFWQEERGKNRPHYNSQKIRGQTIPPNRQNQLSSKGQFPQHISFADKLGSLG